MGVSSTILRTQECREFEKKSRFGSARTYDKQQDCEGNHRGRDIDLLRGLPADPALSLAHPHLGSANPLVHGCLEKADGDGGGGGGSRSLGGGERRECSCEESGRCGPAVAVLVCVGLADRACLCESALRGLWPSCTWALTLCMFGAIPSFLPCSEQFTHYFVCL